MSYRIAFAPASRTDLQAIVRYIAKRSSTNIAQAYGQAITTFCEGLQTFPHRGTLRAGLAAGIRTIGFRDRVTVAFRVSDEQQLVIILGIFYGGRSVEKAFGKTR